MTVLDFCLACKNRDVMILNKYGDEIAKWRHRSNDILRYDGRDDSIANAIVTEIGVYRTPDGNLFSITIA